MGMEVVMYFTFWSIPALLDKNKAPDGTGKILGANLAKSADEMELAQSAPGGIDTAALKAVMAKINMPSLAEMISLAEELGVRIYVSDKSTELLGFERDAFIDYEGLSFAGVATFLAEARKSKIQLFI
jgi:peroxiredoxin family protein